MKQRSILRPATVKGKGLHTGEMVELTFKPAPEDHGIVFQRTDLYGKPTLTMSDSKVTDLVRSTTISSGHAKIHTIEHVLSALSGMDIDNVLIEISGGEPPILDGSAKHFVNALQEAEPVDQEKSRKVLELTEPVSVTSGNRSLIALPYDGLKITCTQSNKL
jgi:UDP-3-O-[3-hydroxymyristoyl] N-acetylglucosamine deacetylase/3-hydroxyacyl-[acyl-carrier-protein] dehydratase